ncbi:hypothetical protein D3C81_847670 [compost metagenome]|uniref:DUF924 domain-containing protein n=1 Tax=Cupriavidus campinensis TaxID=151783 RepID=A0AAE9I312_9BURK|nr:MULTISPECIES: DUF924 family protein [Cupriavidus]URF05092.1 DUF924 domain-containing protein [Cupriavidus campinensis]CAG2157351.1 hypothetical protein LMG19282_05438 [Cupriavidus campinensis]
MCSVKHVKGAQDVLDFWFGTPGSAIWNTARKEWFTKRDAFDATIRDTFLPTWQAAYEGAHDGAADDWSSTPEGTCARLILLDQFPRNMFRGDPRTFATDAQAQALARRMLAQGWDRELPTPWHRMFCYLPFEHAESPEAQDIAVREYITLREDTGGEVDSVEWAVKHQEIIARFGRFPHRNAVLGRASTDDELAFLKQPGSSF